MDDFFDPCSFREYYLWFVNICGGRTKFLSSYLRNMVPDVRSVRVMYTFFSFIFSISSVRLGVIIGDKIFDS